MVVDIEHMNRLSCREADISFEDSEILNIRGRCLVTQIVTAHQHRASVFIKRIDDHDLNVDDGIVDIIKRFNQLNVNGKIAV
jgi:hypothetical protein